MVVAQEVAESGAHLEYSLGGQGGRDRSAAGELLKRQLRGDLFDE